ncbi:P-loop containing nucleoside triphosphate hydrolase protein [Radiomyces spectabilis]|uniref:P-loop containing nucleoside triphosphate hydrolase protein n=1 Tax=Radiomyces spectabilis TaxID=64574 RepID=UPI00221E7269|nr:P-loop containing nucleoside triphosphate hydrolase protein [Radiomyces spectabilis]KAI8377747.1 P-loop containing nucleoside triphosphate hydrolase protein [Radiomyces spectabilis]
MLTPASSSTSTSSNSSLLLPVPYPQRSRSASRSTSLLPRPVASRSRGVSESLQQRPLPRTNNSTSSRVSSTLEAERCHIAVQCHGMQNAGYQIDEQQHVIRVVTGASSAAKKFKFDRFFNGNNSSIDIYRASIKPIVIQAMEGYNGTIIGYGAPTDTSSMLGKTKWLPTDVGLFVLKDHFESGEDGIIFQAIDTLFDMTQQLSDREFLLRMALMEIRNESIRDLLPVTDPQHLGKICDKKTHLGASCRPMASAIQVRKLIHEGLANRYLVSKDPQGHLILQVIIESRDLWKPPSTSQTSKIQQAGCKRVNETVKVSKLTLVLLDDEGQGQFAKSAVDKSLLTLKTILSHMADKGLSSGSNRRLFQESMITQILENSLLGDAKMAFLCTLDGHDPRAITTVLKVATQFRQITSAPRIHEIYYEKSHMNHCQREIGKLQARVRTATGLAGMQSIQTVLTDRLRLWKQYFISSTSPPALHLSMDGEKKPSEHAPMLEQQLLEANAANEELRKQLRATEIRLKELESNSLADRVAQLEVELSITKTELHVTKLLSKESAHFTDAAKDPLIWHMTSL